jgi:hypothetical protein
MYQFMFFNSYGNTHPIKEALFFKYFSKNGLADITAMFLFFL